MANSFTNGYATIFSTVLDELMVQEAVTGWMEDNAGQVQYNGGKTVKIPKMAMSGLGNYSRQTGYPAGDVSMEFETKTMTQDRGRKLSVDSMDVNETNFIPTMSKVASEFQRIHVVPEIDAYRLSALATMAINKDTSVEYGYTVSSATIEAKILAGLKAVKKAGFRGVPCMIHASSDVIEALQLAAGNKLRSMTFSQGGINYEVPSINNNPIIDTDDDRLVSALNIKSDGWEKGSSAIDVNFLIIPRIVPIAVSKQNEGKFFTPKENQNADAWVYDYRRYHDIWTMDNRVAGVFANFKQSKPEGASGATGATGSSGASGASH